MERPSESPFQPYCVQALGPGCGDRLELGLFKVGGVEKREMEVWTCRTSGSQRVSAGADRHERQRNNNNNTHTHTTGSPKKGIVIDRATRCLVQASA